MDGRLVEEAHEEERVEQDASRRNDEIGHAAEHRGESHALTSARAAITTETSHVAEPVSHQRRRQIPQARDDDLALFTGFASRLPIRTNDLDDVVLHHQVEAIVRLAFVRDRPHFAGRVAVEHRCAERFPDHAALPRRQRLRRGDDRGQAVELSVEGAPDLDQRGHVADHQRGPKRAQALDGRGETIATKREGIEPEDVDRRVPDGPGQPTVNARVDVGAPKEGARHAETERPAAQIAPVELGRVPVAVLL